MSAAVPFERRDAVDTAAVALMLLLTLSWGVNGVAVKISNAGFNPVFGSVLRSGLATLFVFGWCRYRNVPLFVRDGTLWPGLVAGALFGTEFALIFIGLDYTSVARSALMVNTMPFWVLIGAHFVLGERMSLTKLLGLAIAFAGVAVVFSDELSLPGPEALTGDLISLAAGALWAATTLVIKRTRLSTARAEKILIYQLAVSAVIAIPLIPLGGSVLLRDLTAVAVGAVLFQAAYIGTFTYILWFWLVNRYPAAGLSSFAFLTPAFGVLMGGLLLGEPLSAKLFLALGMIAAGLIIVNRPTRRNEA